MVDRPERAPLRSWHIFWPRWDESHQGRGEDVDHPLLHQLGRRCEPADLLREQARQVGIHRPRIPSSANEELYEVIVSFRPLRPRFLKRRRRVHF